MVAESHGATFSRRDFVGLSAIALGSAVISLFCIPQDTFALGDQASSLAEYHLSHQLINADVSVYRHADEPCNIIDSQSMGIDRKNKRIYIAKTDPDNSSLSALWSCPVDAASLSDWTLIHVFDNKELGHANGMCCIPRGRGSMLYISRGSKIRTLFIPDAAHPKENFVLGTWECGGFTSKSIAYDTASNKFISRGSLVRQGRQYYLPCWIFDAPTTEPSGTHKVASTVTEFRLHVPTSVKTRSGQFGFDEAWTTPPKSGIQDMCYDGEKLFLPFADTRNSPHVFTFPGKGLVKRTRRNCIISYSLRSIEQLIANHQASGVIVYEPKRVIFDSSIVLNDQSFEMESLVAHNGKPLMLTDESSHIKGIAHDWIREIDLS